LKQRALERVLEGIPRSGVMSIPQFRRRPTCGGRGRSGLKDVASVAFGFALGTLSHQASALLVLAGQAFFSIGAGARVGFFLLASVHGDVGRKLG
jgi:hypothetical protein